MDETRRRLLRSGGLVALLGLAGCSALESEPKPSATPTPTPATVTPPTGARSTPTPAERSSTAPATSTTSVSGGTRTPATDTATPRSGTGPTDTRTATATRAAPETASPTETRTPEAARELRVTDAYWDERSQIVTYRPDGLHAVVRTDEQTEGYGEARLAIGLYRYPDQEVVASVFSEPFDTADAPLERDLTLDPSDPPDGRQAYSLVLAPPEGSSKSSRFLMSTDPFVRRSNGIERAPGSAAVGDRSAPGYERNAVEGQYVLTHEGTADGTEVTAAATLLKVTHAARAAAAPKSKYLDLAAYELRQGQAEPYARVLHERADAAGLTTKATHVDFVTSVVRALPDVPGDVTADSDDDMQYLAETLVGGGGDPQDAAVTLALILQAQPFFYDTRIVEIDGGAHVAVGVSGENADFSGAHYVADDTEYYYLEAVGRDRAVGEIPPEYEGRSATLYEV